MKFGRFKNFRWDHALEQRREWLLELGRWRNRPADKMIEIQARLYLQARFKGPWRLIGVLIANELHGIWRRYGYFKWEWIRTRIFRLPQDEVLAAAQRDEDEEIAIEELARKL